MNHDNPDFNTKCLVHCAMGMSRSATSVIMFIMRLFSMKLEDAFEFVKTQREATDPNDGFMEQLRSFEKTAFAFEQESQDDMDSSDRSSCMVGHANAVRMHRVTSMQPIHTPIKLIGT